MRTTRWSRSPTPTRPARTSSERPPSISPARCRVDGDGLMPRIRAFAIEPYEVDRAVIHLVHLVERDRGRGDRARATGHGDRPRLVLDPCPEKDLHGVV